MHLAEKASKLVLYKLKKKYIFKLFSATLKVTGISKCWFTNNGPAHYSTLKNDSDKYCNITAGSGRRRRVWRMHISSEAVTVGIIPTVTGLDKEEQKILILGYAKEPSWLVQGWQKYSEQLISPL